MESQECKVDHHQDSLLRDLMIIGTNDFRLQEKLSSEDDLTLNKGRTDCRGNRTPSRNTAGRFQGSKLHKKERKKIKPKNAPIKYDRKKSINYMRTKIFSH